MKLQRPNNETLAEAWLIEQAGQTFSHLNTLIIIHKSELRNYHLNLECNSELRGKLMDFLTDQHVVYKILISEINCFNIGIVVSAIYFDKLFDFLFD